MTKKSNIELLDKIAKRNTTEIIRNEDGIIIGYKFNIKRRSGGPLIGTLSRSQMDTLCSLYSRYGADLTLAQTSLDFPEYSLDELNRIKSAFLIFKYTCPFAPHEIDENSEDVLHDLAIERKKNNLTRTLEKNQLKDAQKINLKLTEELQKYKNLETAFSDIKIDLTNFPTVSKSSKTASGNILLLHLADLHIGAKVESHSLYDNPYDKTEIVKRLSNILTQINNLPIKFDTIYLNLLGDMLDGMDNQTARRDHFMPQCMDNKEQIDTFINVMIWFISELRKIGDLKVYSVPNGNHCGAAEYASIIALKNVVNEINGCEMVIFPKFIGFYTINDDCFLFMHGKDSSFMKRGMPLHLTDNANTWINNYLDREGITNKFSPGKIHVIKGDLHSAAYDSNLKYDYRNCLSLFGDSDYSQMNYNSNPRGCSYSIILNNQLINGELTV